MGGGREVREVREVRDNRECEKIVFRSLESLISLTPLDSLQKMLGNFGSGQRFTIFAVVKRYLHVKTDSPKGRLQRPYLLS